MDNNLIDATPLEAYWGTAKLDEIWFNDSRIWPAKGTTDSYLQLKFDPNSNSGWSAAANAATSYNILAYAGAKVHVLPPKPHGSNYDVDDVIFVLHMSADGQTWTGNVTEITSNAVDKGYGAFLDSVDMAPVPFADRNGCTLTISPTCPVGSRFVLVKGGFGAATKGDGVCGYITIIE
jgi:hypothetical protein